MLIRTRARQFRIQLLVHPDLPARILYTWTDLYSQQLQSGQDYSVLSPTYAIWLLAADLLPDIPAYAHRYCLRDECGRRLLDHGGIAVFELSKFAAVEVATEEQRWLKFFKEVERQASARRNPTMRLTRLRGFFTAPESKRHRRHGPRTPQCYACVQS